MTEFVSIPAIMFIVMVGFIIFLLAFNFYLFYKWDKTIQELDEIKKPKEYPPLWSKIDI